ncbi:hypothetical protein BKA82DRAFT_3034683 [Pisolithus tinctorius]|nr:hypothetical protein BKA82DRAFT_3034683 [Pisolithus tinctorius]
MQCPSMCMFACLHAIVISVCHAILVSSKRFFRTVPTGAVALGNCCGRRSKSATLQSGGTPPGRQLEPERSRWYTNSTGLFTVQADGPSLMITYSVEIFIVALETSRKCQTS